MKFSEYLKESLADEVKSEPKTKASAEARRMGLTYMGFGRYADRSGKAAYIVHNDELFPIEHTNLTSKMYAQTKTDNPEKTKAASDQMRKAIDVSLKRGSEDKKIIKSKEQEALKVSKELYNFYNRQSFDKDEIEALEWYTAEGYESVNRYLYKGHDEGTDNKKSAKIEQTIEALDEAFEHTEAPFKYTVYTGLSERYKAENFKAGSEYIFRGYVSTTLDFFTSVSMFTQGGILLQVDIEKGQKSIYVDGVSSNTGEMETLLPRGSRLRVISGPHPIHAEAIVDVQAYDTKNTLVLFTCKLIEDK